MDILSDAVWEDCKKIVDHANKATQDMAWYCLVTGAFANELCLKVTLDIV